VRAREDPRPPPFPVGVQVRYTGTDEVDWSDGAGHCTELQHGTVGLVVRNFPGISGRAAGTFGSGDEAFRTVHRYSQVAYLCAIPVMVGAESGPCRVYGAEQFRNLEPEGVPAELAEERLAHYREYYQSIPSLERGVDAEAER
jgi:hypothetical protein